MSAQPHIVIGPLVIATDESGNRRYFYKDEPIPDSIPAAEVARLVEMRLVGPVDGGKKPATGKH